MSAFDLIAHRGYSAEAPENTFASFDLALQRGYLHLETDCQLTKDGQAVLFHDKELDRRSNGKGQLADALFEHVNCLDAGSWFAPAFEGQRVPLLADFLKKYFDAASVQPHLHLELKSNQPDLPQVVHDVLQAHGCAEGFACRPEGPDFAVPGLTITSFHLDQLRRSKKLCASLRHGWLVVDMTDDVIQQAVELGLLGLYPLAKHVTGGQVSKALAAGLSVRGWGVKTLDDLFRLVDCGAQGCTVDWPDKAAQALAHSTARV